MKIPVQPGGTIRTRDLDTASMKVAKDIVKLDANKDGVIATAEVSSVEKRLAVADQAAAFARQNWSRTPAQDSRGAEAEFRAVARLPLEQWSRGCILSAAT